MRRVAETFARLEAQGRIALMPYLTVGFPERSSTIELVLAMEQAGASLFELGVPFSDPLADGATIQRAGQRALENGVTLTTCIETVAQLRDHGVKAPLILMGYYNPMLRYGISRACADLAAAGGDGWIIPDLPPEEAHAMRHAATAHDLDLILFVAPTTPDARIARIATLTSGFLYCVSLTGVTGARSELAEGLGTFLDRVRTHTNVPLVVGFGISRPEHVAQVARHADGAIVGSALIALIEEQPPDNRIPEVANYIRLLAAAT